MPAHHFHLDRRAMTVALMAGGTALTGLTIFAIRSERAQLGDGPVSFWAVFVFGLLVSVLPLADTSYRLMHRSRRMYVPIALVSVAMAVVLAIGAPRQPTADSVTGDVRN